MLRNVQLKPDFCLLILLQIRSSKFHEKTDFITGSSKESLSNHFILTLTIMSAFSISIAILFVPLSQARFTSLRSSLENLHNKEVQLLSTLNSPK